MREGDIINRYLVRLTNSNEASLGLKDDVALLGGDVIITTDTTIEGVHIIPGISPSYIAYKAMARAFSDIFAKGGSPIGYFTNLILPRRFCRIEDLVRGLGEFAGEYGVDLLGGDLSAHDGDRIIIAVTVLAKVKKNMPRFGAKIGDGLYITKSIGKAYLGFMDCNSGIYTTENAKEYLKPSLFRIDDSDGINASMDISDGLIRDAEKMAKASAVCFEIDYHLLPFASLKGDVQSMLSFGDDYNILISSSTDIPSAILIGKVCRGGGLALRNFPFDIKDKGYEHFTGIAEKST